MDILSCFKRSITQSGDVDWVIVLSNRNLLNPVQCKLIVGSIVQRRSAGALMRRDFLSGFECSVVFKINSYPGRAERMAAYRSGYAGSERSPVGSFGRLRIVTLAVRSVPFCGRFERAVCLAQNPLFPDTRPCNPGPCGGQGRCLPPFSKSRNQRRRPFS